MRSPRPPAPAPCDVTPHCTAAASHPEWLQVTYNAGFFDAYDVLDCTVVQAGLLMKVGAGWRAVLRCAALLGCKVALLASNYPGLLHLLPAGLPARQRRVSPTSPAPLPPVPQHVMSVFRTQRVEKILFDLSTADCKATVTLHCENGAGLLHGTVAAWPRLQLCVGRCTACAPLCGRACGLLPARHRHRPHAPMRCCCCPSPALPSLPSVPSGLVKSYKLPTMDSEILQARKKRNNESPRPWAWFERASRV